MASIRGKITLGYLVLLIGAGGFVLFASADLRFLEQRIHGGVAFAAFQERVQEMRRHEKNYFLYQTHGEGGGELELVRGAAASLLQALEMSDLLRVTGEAERRQLRQGLLCYQQLLQQPILMEQELRASGHHLSTMSEQLAERERATLLSTARQSRYLLFVAIGVLLLLAMLGGQLIYRLVGRPLHQLEQQLRPLAQGRFQAFSIVSKDREIVSFTQALNRMLEELELRRRQVLHAEKLASLGTLASGVAHELNNPLANISGAAQILLEEIDSLSDSQREALRGWLLQIDEETERARHIVQTLLDYSRRRPVEVVPIPLIRALKKSLILLGLELPVAERVHYRIPPQLQLQADPRRLQQIFINLIQNAFLAGASQVEIEATAADANQWPPAGAGAVLGDPDLSARAALIRLWDDGPGIAAQQLGQIFDPFYTTRAPGEGTGLGLYIVAEIVYELHGGIAVSSPAGSGLCFSLWLPCGENP